MIKKTAHKAVQVVLTYQHQTDTLLPILFQVSRSHAILSKHP